MENLFINVFFTLFMLGLALWDYKSYGRQKHRDLKSIIMSTGVLGTFVGIFVGLQDFDVSNVENSVPSLLAGLQTAFYTSILGMALAIVLSILQKSKAVKTDFENTLDYFSLQIAKLDHLETLKDLIALNQQTLTSQNTYQSQQMQNFKTIEESLVYIQATLKESIQHLAKGASKELIAALQEVIKDFNLRITDQFGDNFKELNHAVAQMIAWQNSYKDSIAGLDSSLKSTLTLFRSTQETLELVASRNTEVLEVYNALAGSIEASRIENEKLSALLREFDTMHENAALALQSVENLSNHLKTTHEESLNYTKGALQQVQNFLQESSTTHHNQLQIVLENSLKSIEEDAKAQNAALISLQNAFSDFNILYLEQNKTQLHSLVESLNAKLTTFLEDFSNSDSTLKQKNLEMIAHIQTNIQGKLENIEESFYKNLATLENAQKESLLLIEQQARHSDDVLMHHTQAMESVVEKASHHLQELSDATQQNLSKNSDTLEQHILNAVLNFDSLLGKTTKSLEENFAHSKNTLIELSKEIESQMVATTKSLNSLLNDTAGTLSATTQNLEDSLTQTSTTLSANFKIATDSITETLTSGTKTIAQNFALHCKNIGENIVSLLEQSKNHNKNLNTLLEYQARNFTKNLESLHKESTQQAEKMQGQLRASFAESYKNAIDSLSAYLKNTTNTYQNKLQDLSKMSMEQNQALSADLSGELNAIAQGFQANSQKVIQSVENLAQNIIQTSQTTLDIHTQKLLDNYNALDNSMKATLQEMAKNYLNMLELLTTQSLETPKNVSIELLNSFGAFQRSLSESLNQTHLALQENRKEMDAILNITQTNINSSLNQATQLNTSLCQSLGELDNALANMTLGFRQDYEWFLRRIREIMGARG